MSALPKSLHTVRILVAVARELALVRDSSEPVLVVLRAARLIGYPDARTDDPLIVRAAAQLAAPAKS